MDATAAEHHRADPERNDVLGGLALRLSGVAGFIAELGFLLFLYGRMTAGLQHHDDRGCEQDRCNDSQERDCLEQR